MQLIGETLQVLPKAVFEDEVLLDHSGEPRKD
jgi:hypothetical protein